MILTEDSCEQKVYAALLNKNVRMDTLLDLMKEQK